MGEIFDAGEFVICFPVWAASRPGDITVGALKARHPDGSLAVPLFTDHDLAKRFLDAKALPVEFAVKELHPLALLGLLAALELGGVTRVIFDPTPIKTASVGLADFRAALARWVNA